MKGKKASHLRIVKNNEIEQEENLKQRLKAVYQDMERIIDLIDSNVERDKNLSSIAK
jgi:hypothetical protein